MNKNMNKNTLAKILISGAVVATLIVPTIVSAAASSTANKKMTPEERMLNQQDRGQKEIDNRVDKLNKLLSRVQEMRNLSDSQKTSIATIIQTQVSNLNALKAKITADTSTTTLKEDLKSITQTYRIYALIIPQINIIAAADRIETVIGMMNTIGAKLSARIAADPDAVANAAVKTSMTDLSTKLADADTQAKAAVSAVSALAPDNGDKTKYQANIAVLKDAKSKIHTAQQDLTAARKDAQSVVKVLMKNLKSLMDNKRATSTNDTGGSMGTSTGTTTNH